MPTSNFRIRLATVEDVDKLVDLHYRVFDVRTHYLLVLSRRFMVRAYQWYCAVPEAFTLLVESEGEIVACTTVNQGSYYTVFWRNWKHVMREFIFRPALCLHPLVLRRMRVLLTSGHGKSRQRGSLNNSAYLAYLAVNESARGKGVGASLVRATLAECRARGWEELLTCFHRNNVPARFLYKTLGWVEVPELGTEELVGLRISTGRGEQCSVVVGR